MSRVANQSYEIAQLAHVELLTPKLDESLDFFTQLLGMQVTERVGQSVYLRGYEDTYHHSLVLTEAPDAGLGHVAWRSTTREALESRVAAIEATGLGLGWQEPTTGHGRAYRFTSPEGHVNELLWDVEYFACPADQKSRLANRAQRRPNIGIPVRRLDHLNLLCRDVSATKDFYTDTLTFRLRERIEMDDGLEMGAWLSVSVLAHEIALMHDATGSGGRFHHVAFWYGIPQHLADAAELLVEHGIEIEAGPGKHGITQSLFMYVYEPGGNRIELFGDTGHLILDPDWTPVTWHEDQLETGVVVYGSKLPDQYFTYGTPHVEMPAADAAEIADRMPAPAAS
jgi:catechol 2,3-dioxygenase